ncbi:hypothetical protein BBBOND_0404550 [Babesia bigemina]|uniref:Uncharacterized protein n=1 Tax=Babesia bigemina TaxID=5866 RepID=A0A061DBN1_BABBI|nr:hypothetical protein BBBOND_0404550 [Babesia bigemina]CDR97968.1 hypothetical protein BBBOND_0404550 [Babesia bigemina]|eukprot:XP_012770154.1 hypothetical protein BBBOND_0404550 [Babesia bigemina]
MSVIGFKLKMSWLLKHCISASVLAGCMVSGVILDIESDVLPDGVEVFYGTFPNGGIYRFIRGTDEMITESTYSGSSMYCFLSRMEHLAYSHVEDFRRGEEHYVRYYIGRKLNGRVIIRSNNEKRLGWAVNPQTTSELETFISGWVLLPVDATGELPQHPLIHTTRAHSTNGSVTYRVKTQFPTNTGLTVKIRTRIYKLGEIHVSHINDISLGCTSIFRIACDYFKMYMDDEYYHIVTDTTDIQVDVTDMLERNVSDACITSPTSSGPLGYKGSEGGAPSFDLTSPEVSDANGLIEVNEATPGAAHMATRSIYVLVPTQLGYEPRFEEYATYDPSSNTVTYDIDFLTTHYAPQCEGKRRTTIWLRAVRAVVRSDSTCVFFCAASTDAPIDSRDDAQSTESVSTSTDDANDLVDMDNFIEQMTTPGMDTISDLLNASDVVNDDVDAGGAINHLYSIIDVLTTKLDEVVPNWMDDVAAMDSSEVEDSCVESGASTSFMPHTQISEATDSQDAATSQNATMEHNVTGVGDQSSELAGAISSGGNAWLDYESLLADICSYPEFDVHEPSRKRLRL